jgi:DedD protein
VTSLLKQRLIGAIVLISLGIIFIPMLLTGRGQLFTDDTQSNIPPKPMYEIQAPAVLPLDKPQTQAPVTESIVSSQPEISSPTTKSQSDTQDSAANDKARVPSSEAAPTQVIATEEANSSKVPTAANIAAEVEKATHVEKTAPVEKKSQPAKSAPAATVAKVDIATVKKPIVSGWVVQLGSFSVEKNAITLQDSLRKKGYASFVESYSNDNKTIYRVRVGPELTRELAEKLQVKLKSETRLNGLVMAFPAK